MDLHLEWFRQRLSKLFSMDLEYVDVLINDNFEQLKRFFDADFTVPPAPPSSPPLVASVFTESEDSQKVHPFQDERILFVYRTFYDRLVENEVTVLEEVPHVVEVKPVKEKQKKGRGGAGGGAGGGGKEKRSKDLKDEDAEVKLDKDFLLDGNNAPATAAAAGTTAWSGCHYGALFIVVICMEKGEMKIITVFSVRPSRYHSTR